MHINKLDSNTNFKGYKNVIAKSIKINSRPGTIDRAGSLTFLSMQLDNLKHSDLEIWKQIQNKLFGTSQVSDTLCVVATKLKDLPAVISWGNKVTGTKENLAPDKKIIASESYLWLTELTKRIMNENNLIYDDNLANTMRKTIHEIHPLVKNFQKAFTLVLSSQMPPNNHPQEAALKINQALDPYLIDFLN